MKAVITLVLVMFSSVSFLSKSQGGIANSGLRSRATEFVIARSTEGNNYGFDRVCSKLADDKIAHVRQVAAHSGISTNALEFKKSIRLANACARPGGCPTMPLRCAIGILSTDNKISFATEFGPEHDASREYSLCQEEKQQKEIEPGVFMTRIETAGWVFNTKCVVVTLRFLF